MGEDDQEDPIMGTMRTYLLDALDVLRSLQSVTYVVFQFYMLLTTVASKRGYTDLPETSSRQLPTGSSSD